MATFAFDAQFLLDITLRSDQAHQRFGLMSVKLIGDKDPGRLGVRLNGLSDVSGMATSRLAIKLKVPCRLYSNSSRST